MAIPMSTSPVTRYKRFVKYMMALAFLLDDTLTCLEFGEIMRQF
jgi:hypothetical protein